MVSAHLLLWGSSSKTFQKRILEVGGGNIQSLSMGMRAGNDADLLISRVSLRQPVWSDCPTGIYIKYSEQ